VRQQALKNPTVVDVDICEVGGVADTDKPNNKPTDKPTKEPTPQWRRQELDPSHHQYSMHPTTTTTASRKCAVNYTCHSEMCGPTAQLELSIHQS